jgi:glycosyltransferase involved in cell wall biosynthesis
MTVTRRRVVVATADSVTPKMAGPAIRAWQIASALSREHDVHLVTTTRCTVTQPDGFRVSALDDRGLREAEQWCDLFIFQGWVMASRPYLRDSEKVVVVDIYDPIHLEQLEQGRRDRAAKRHRVMHAASAVLNEQLLRGDFFICASDKQRDFWLGHLATLGRVNPVTYDEDETLRSLISVVPFGISDEPPVKTRPALKGVVPGIAPDDKVILWGGGIYNWFDPLSLIRAVDRLRYRRPDVRLFFMGLRHPNPDILEMRMAVEARRLAKQLGLTGTHVFFNEDWVDYDARQNYLLEADVGVSTHLDHLETAYSFRTRVLDYLWASLPIVATRGDSLAELIEERKLGVTVPPGDVDALEHAISRLLEDDAFAASCRENMRAVAAGFAWSEVLRPLMQFCRQPRRAPDLLVPELVSQLRRDLSVPAGMPRGLRLDAMLVRDYFHDGGVRLVVTKASGRLRRWARVLRPAARWSITPETLDRRKPGEP